MHNLKILCVLLANRFGWLYMVTQSDIDWYRFKLTVKHLKLLFPHTEYISTLLANYPKSDYVVLRIIEVILWEGDAELAERIRHEVDIVHDLMANSLILLAAREAILAAIDVRLGNRNAAIERYLEVVSINTQLEQKGERGIFIGSLTKVIFNNTTIQGGIFNRERVD